MRFLACSPRDAFGRRVSREQGRREIETARESGEVLDIDGVTGGYNLTAAWLTGLTAAEGIARRVAQPAAQR